MVFQVDFQLFSLFVLKFCVNHCIDFGNKELTQIHFRFSSFFPELTTNDAFKFDGVESNNGLDICLNNGILH